MSDYIKREDAIKAISKDIMGGLNYEYILNHLPSADVNEIFEKAIICGYTLKDLTVFADACRKKGISEKDLADFNRNAASAYKYVLEEIERQFEDVVIDKWHVKEEE